MAKEEPKKFDRFMGDYGRFCPFGNVGDRLWVREPAKVRAHRISYHDSTVTYQFGDGFVQSCKVPTRLESPDGCPPNWVYKCHGVPNGCIREMSRSLLDILEIRVERIQDITHEKARAEGFTCELQFIQGWKRLYGVASWEKNDWVWVIKFRRVETGKD